MSSHALSQRPFNYVIAKRSFRERQFLIQRRPRRAYKKCFFFAKMIFILAVMNTNVFHTHPALHTYVIHPMSDTISIIHIHTPSHQDIHHLHTSTQIITTHHNVCIHIYQYVLLLEHEL